MENVMPGVMQTNWRN